MKLADAAARVLASGRPIAVTGPDGVLIGAVTREAMIAALYPAKTP